MRAYRADSQHLRIGQSLKDLDLLNMFFLLSHRLIHVNSLFGGVLSG